MNAITEQIRVHRADVQSPVQRDDVDRVRPTLLIGLGGTGREVLLRLRQRLVERYGTPSFPITGYLWIDTDVGDRETVEGKPKDFLSGKARLREEELLDATISSTEFLNYFENAQQYPGIFSWIYAGTRKSGSVLDGARAVRPLGRLAFFRHFARIRKRITETVASISNSEARERMLREHGIDVAEEGIDVQVVFSVAGGTGSGMFLDLAFLLRHLSRRNEIPPLHSTGYLVLPPLFAKNNKENERFYANGYAALKELEFFSSRKDQRHDLVGEQRSVADLATQGSEHDFVVQWEERGTPVRVVGPPFNTCFLVGSAPAGKAPIPPRERGDVFDMIAESIFLDFARHQLASKRRSVRSNLEEALANELEYAYLKGEEPVFRDLFSFRFSAFGLAKLYVPTDRIRRACTYKLCADLLDGWLANNPPAGDPRSYLVQYELDPLGLRGPALRDALDRMTDAGQHASALIQNHWTTTLRADLVAATRLPQPALKGRLVQAYARFEQEYFDQPEDEARWGTVIRRLRKVTKPALEQQLRVNLLERIHVWLNSPRIRISGAAEYLRVLNKMLEELEAEWRNAARARQEQADLSRREWTRLLGVVQDEEEGLWVHRWSLRALVDAATVVASRYFEHLAFAEIYRLGAGVLEGLQRHIGAERVEVVSQGEDVVIRSGMVQRLFELQGHLHTLLADFHRRLEAFDRTDDHLVFTNLYRPRLFETFYRYHVGAGTPEPIDAKILSELELKLRERLSLRSPYDLLAAEQAMGLGMVREKIEEFSEEPFRDLDRAGADAVLLLYEQEKDREPGGRTVEQTIARLAELGNTWLNADVRARGNSPLAANYQAAAVLGIHHSNHPRYLQFQEELAGRVPLLPGLKGGAATAVDTPADAVYLYTEISGIPLAYIEDIANYRDAYRSQKAEFLHIDRHTDRFTDIVLKGHSEVEAAVKVNRVALLGIFLGVLEVAGNGREAVIAYVDRSIFPPERRTIGTRLDAYDRLAADAGVLRSIAGEVDERIRQMTPAQREQFYTLLAYHVHSGDGIGAAGPFARKEVRLGEAKLDMVPVEHHAITEALREMERRFRDERNWAADEVAARAAALFNAWYPRRHEFAEEVTLGNHLILVFHSARSAEPAAPSGGSGLFDEF